MREGSDFWSFLWGYFHYFVFASAAAVGAGLAVQIDFASHTALFSGFWAGQTVAISVAIFPVSLACLRGDATKDRCARWLVLIALLCLAASALPLSPLVPALILGAITALLEIPKP